MSYSQTMFNNSIKKSILLSKLNTVLINTIYIFVGFGNNKLSQILKQFNTDQHLHESIFLFKKIQSEFSINLQRNGPNIIVSYHFKYVFNFVFYIQQCVLPLNLDISRLLLK